MDTIDIEYEIEYVDCNLADKRIESEPRLRTYFDGHFVREYGVGVVDTQLDEDDLTKVYAGRLKARTGGRSIPANAKIGFSCYAKVNNADGGKNYVRVGTAFQSVEEIITTTTRMKPFEKELPLEIETTRMFDDVPVEKGRIKFRVVSCKLGKGVKMVASMINESLTGSDEIPKFIEARAAFESSFQNTFPGTTNVRMPMNLSTSGKKLLLLKQQQHKLLF